LKPQYPDDIERNTMAIYSSVPPPDQQPAANGVDIEAWTVEALQSLQISSLVQGTGVTLTIPLNDPLPEPAPKIAKKKTVSRESLKRRETLLKGKEGSRRRQRWENGRFSIYSNAVIEFLVQDILITDHLLCLTNYARDPIPP
jgi:hypothetical protein